MNVSKLRGGCAIAFLVYWVLSIGFFWIAGEQIRVRANISTMLTPSANTGEILAGQEITQRLTVDADTISAFDFYLSTLDRTNTCTVRVRIVDEQGNTLAQTKFSAEQVQDNALHRVGFETPAQVKSGVPVELIVDSPDGTNGNAVCLWYGSTISATRSQVDYQVAEEDRVRIDGTSVDGMLCIQTHTQTNLWLGQYYLPLVLICGAFLGIYLLLFLRAAKAGESLYPLRLIATFQRYGYLMRQLVARDFKTKYKRSVLGILWSFLNPLLTMLVQYIVFSTLFKSDIPNFALYLLAGIVCFNFFNEATAMSLQSIVGNANLITKVYVPKYIYPLSRVCSSTINLFLSLIPLMAVLFITHTPITPAIVLLLFGIICLFALCVGVGMFLAAAMVFFRDTQFLWGVLSMLWMYATPVFYPESIIPAAIMPIYKCNPLYHIIRFIRIILMDGISPEPKAYLFCLIASLLPLLIGVLVFKRTQNKFVLNL